MLIYYLRGMFIDKGFYLDMGLSSLLDTCIVESLLLYNKYLFKGEKERKKK